LLQIPLSPNQSLNLYPFFFPNKRRGILEIMAPIHGDLTKNPNGWEKLKKIKKLKDGYTLNFRGFLSLKGYLITNVMEGHGRLSEVFPKTNDL
jgi:hypothetical protein